MANIEIGGRLHSTATGNVVTGANEVLDDTKNKKQSVINAEVDETIGDDNTAGTIKGRIKTAEGKLDTLNGDSSTSGSVAKAVADAKTELIGGATSNGNTLKKVEDRTATLETAVGSNGSVDQRIAAAKSEVIGDAASDYNTLGKLEDKIQAEASARESAVSTEAQARQDAITAETNRATTRENQIYDLVHTPEQHYVTVATYADLANIASPSDDTVYRVSSYNGKTSQVDNTVYSEYGYDGTNFVFLCVKSQIDEVYDISAHHSNNTYVDLAAALDGGNNIPQELRRGGMSVKFISSSDNKYVQYRLMNKNWSTTVTDWQGVDESLNIFSNNLLSNANISKGLVPCYHKTFNRNAQILKIEPRWIDEAYIKSDGTIDYMATTESYHYQAVYMLDIHEYSRVIISRIRSTGNSYIVLYDENKNVLSAVNCEYTSYTVDNSAGSYYYLSFSNRVNSVSNLSLLAFVRNPIQPSMITLTQDYTVELTVPEELISQTYKLRDDDEIVYDSNFPNVCTIKDFDISAYKKIFLSLLPSTEPTLNKLILIDVNGNISIQQYTGNVLIDNSTGQYKYLSVCYYYLHIYSLGKVQPALECFNLINNKIDELQNRTLYLNDNVEDSKVSIGGYIHYNKFIRENGQAVNIQETSSYRYDSVVLLPVNDLNSFIISGTSGNSYAVLFDENFNVLESLQGTDIEVDNSSHQYFYLSFGANIKARPLYVKSAGKEDIKQAIENLLLDKEAILSRLESIEDIIYYDDEYILKDKELNWLSNKYITADNKIRGTVDGPTYHYEAVKDIDVHLHNKIRFKFIAGDGYVVTSDVNHAIIRTYTSGDYIIDNSDGNIYYLSICNNFIAEPNPIFQLSELTTVKDKIQQQENVINQIDLQQNQLKGKNVAVLGDSIMMVMAQSGISGGTMTYVGTDGVTYQLSELTNIGGLLYVTSTLVDGQIVEGTTIQADIHNSNQAILNVETWQTLKDALGANYVINTGRGGARITGNNITTAYPCHGQVTVNTMPNHCLELKRRVDAGEPSPNVIMMWAGTNDVRNFVVDGNWVEPTNFDEIMALDYETQLLANTDAAMTYKKTFYGGLRFCIEFLYRNFPNATIIFFSPIPSIVSPRTFDRERLVGSYIKKMAERYGALFVDSCVEMGITDKFDTETNHVWLHDGLHPNAAGKVLYCNYTAKKLNNIMFSKI